MQLKISRPVTVYISFKNGMPRYFSLTGEKNGLYYFRYLDGKTPRIKFNIVDPDTYDSNFDFNIVKTVAVETPAVYPELPAAERDRFKEVTFRYDPSLQGTPAAIYSYTGEIVHGPSYYKLPRPIRLFIDLHEQGHLFYKTESFCDLWALVNYLRMGYNRSMAYYTLSNILGESQENISRLESLFSNIQITQSGTL